MLAEAVAGMTEVERHAWDAYGRVRSGVLRMKGAGATGIAEPSAYWNEELSNIDYMADATPLIVRRLRQHAFWITGLRAYEYRTHNDERHGLFEGRLRALLERGGADLAVPEPESLGGFGYPIDGGLYNLDTLKFLEVLVGMRRSGILDQLSRTSRPVVVEIGGGWGGLAYQIKTLIPDATYVIVDLPEVFLFSAVYLGALFPDARHVFATGTDATPAGADFVYVSNTNIDAIRTMSPDVMVNVASFQEMTTAQVDAYGAAGASARCHALYSLNRERSRHNTELTGITDVLTRYYDLHQVDVLDTDYTQAMKKPSKARKPKTGGAPEDPLLYRHLAGRLRGAGPVPA